MKKSLAFLLCLSIILSMTACASVTIGNDSNEPSVEETQQVAEEQKQEEQNAVSMTMGQRNALSAALLYLRSMPFSYESLIEQLEYEEFSTEDATFAADNCGADWYEQAVRQAETYLRAMPLSLDGLIEQLEYEGFTSDQAKFGAETAYNE